MCFSNWLATFSNKALAFFVSFCLPDTLDNCSPLPIFAVPCIKFFSNSSARDLSMLYLIRMRSSKRRSFSSITPSSSRQNFTSSRYAASSAVSQLLFEKVFSGIVVSLGFSSLPESLINCSKGAKSISSSQVAEAFCSKVSVASCSNDASIWRINVLKSVLSFCSCIRVSEVELLLEIVSL